MSGWPTGPAGRMFSLVSELPDQLAASGDLPGVDRLSPLPDRPRQLLLCGMGGSAIAGDLIQPCLAAEDFAFGIHRDYGLPAWAGRETLVVASSYSGNTEETVSAFQEAAARGCSLLAVTSGGELLAASQAGGTAGFPAVILPTGLPPRAAVGYSAGALLWGLHGLGLIHSPQGELEAAVAVLREGNERLRAGGPSDTNDCTRLASDCLNRFLVIYTSSAAAHGAGLRWKAQLNENAKCPAYSAAFPELNHNDIVGWRMVGKRKDDFVLVILRGGNEDAQMNQRVTVTHDLLEGEFHAVHQITARGGTVLARVFSLVQFGDYLSCYLALAAEVDPLPVERIDVLKKRLQEGS